MIWSVSTAKMFERCQRQWFFKTQLASAKAKDEMRRRAWLLSKLQSLSAWRGNLVDQVLSQEVLPAFGQGRSITSDQALASAMARLTVSLPSVVRTGFTRMDLIRPHSERTLLHSTPANTADLLMNRKWSGRGTK